MLDNTISLWDIDVYGKIHNETNMFGSLSCNNQSYARMYALY